MFNLPHYSVFAVVPLYLPISRLRGFQQFRAEYKDYLKLKGRMSQLGIDEKEFFHTIESYNEKAVVDLIKGGFDYSAYYELDMLPPVNLVLQKLQSLKTNYVYPDIASCLYSWFDLSSIANIIFTG